MGLTVLTIDVFANDPQAIHVCEKAGFSETGRVPKDFFKEGKYVDKVIMTKVTE